MSKDLPIAFTGNAARVAKAKHGADWPETIPAALVEGIGGELEALTDKSPDALAAIGGAHPLWIAAAIQKVSLEDARQMTVEDAMGIICGSIASVDASRDHAKKLEALAVAPTEPELPVVEPAEEGTPVHVPLKSKKAKSKRKPKLADE